MFQRIIAALLRFAHREGWLLKIADYFDPAQPKYADFEEVPRGEHSAE